MIYRISSKGSRREGSGSATPRSEPGLGRANRMALTLIWHGKFMDASKALDRPRTGAQGPLGDDVHEGRGGRAAGGPRRSGAAVAFRRAAGTGAAVPRDSPSMASSGRHSGTTRPRSCRDFPEPRRIDQSASFQRHLTVTATGTGPEGRSTSGRCSP